MAAQAQTSRQRLHVAQDADQPVQWANAGRLNWRWASARAAETRAVGDHGQDYLTLDAASDRLAFALCDGVGQSFYGELAARLLGDAVLEWLLDGLPPTLDVQAVAPLLASTLDGLVERARPVVDAYPLPPTLPPITRAVLDEKRALGSQATLACGRIDLPSDAFPAGRLVLAWLGDSRLRLWTAAGEASALLDGRFATEERWSSRVGPVGGAPHVFIAPLKAAAPLPREPRRSSRQDGHVFMAPFNVAPLRRLMAYSDGLATLDALAAPLTDAALQALIERAEESAVSDDISFLEVWLEPPSALSDLPWAATPSVPAAAPDPDAPASHLGAPAEARDPPPAAPPSTCATSTTSDSAPGAPDAPPAAAPSTMAASAATDQSCISASAASDRDNEDGAALPVPSVCSTLPRSVDGATPSAHRVAWRPRTPPRPRPYRLVGVLALGGLLALGAPALAAFHARPRPPHGAAPAGPTVAWPTPSPARTRRPVVAPALQAAATATFASSRTPSPTATAAATASPTASPSPTPSAAPTTTTAPSFAARAVPPATDEPAANRWLTPVATSAATPPPRPIQGQSATGTG